MGKLGEVATWDYFVAHIAEAWKHMQLLKEAGLASEIGVSNFYPQHLKFMETHLPGVVPFANQIYLDASHHEAEFVRFMQERGMKVIAYRPVAFVPVYGMSKDMGDNTWDVVDAESKTVDGAKSHQQLIIAWLIRRGCHVLVKSSDEERALDNIAAARLAVASGWS